MPEKLRCLPEATSDHLVIGGPNAPVPAAPEPPPPPPVIADSPCPCCGRLTIPNGGDALAYICPECFWEIDLFISSDDEASDQNHGLTLNQARENYRVCGVSDPRLRDAKDQMPRRKKAVLGGTAHRPFPTK